MGQPQHEVADWGLDEPNARIFNKCYAFFFLTLIGIFGCDPGGDDVAPGRGPLFGLVEGDLRHPPRGLPVQQTNVLDVIQRQTHGDLLTKLR